VKLNHTAGAVLGQLMREPMTGWQITELVEMSLCDFFHVTRSQIYRELRVLADAGLVEPGETGPREQRPYAVTAAGREAFRAWLQEEPGADLFRSPFFLKLSFAEHLDPATVIRFVDLHRQRNEARLAYYRELQPTAEAFSPNSGHVLRAGIAFREALLRWLESLPWSDAIRHRDPPRPSPTQPV
jgi:DNA-binding PadR family transcriptional regulator